MGGVRVTFILKSYQVLQVRKRNISKLAAFGVLSPKQVENILSIFFTRKHNNYHFKHTKVVSLPIYCMHAQRQKNRNDKRWIIPYLDLNNFTLT